MKNIQFQKRSSNEKGFTLIELLVVIAIVATLAVVAVLVLNPAQLLRQGRDSNRISDLNTVKSAISLYLADVITPVIGSSTQRCYTHSSSSIVAGTGCAGTTGARFAAGTNTTSTSIAVNGSGWIPVEFTLISSGSPLSAVPRDPVNNATYFYAYSADQTLLTFELNAEMESSRYQSTGGGDVESTDGGNATSLYETGTAPGLSL